MYHWFFSVGGRGRGRCFILPLSRLTFTLEFLSFAPIGKFVDEKKRVKQLVVVEGGLAWSALFLPPLSPLPGLTLTASSPNGGEGGEIGGRESLPASTPPRRCFRDHFCRFAKHHLCSDKCLFIKFNRAVHFHQWSVLGPAAQGNILGRGTWQIRDWGARREGGLT